MSLIRYNPTGANALQQQINHLFNQFDTDFFGRGEEIGGGMFAPAMDVKEDAHAYTVQLEVPGVPRDKIDITLQDGALVIRGAREPKAEKTEGHYRRVERSYGSFSRSLTLPRAVDGAQVSADLHDGVLTVRLPKAEDAKPRQIAIGATQETATPARENTNEEVVKSEVTEKR
ncbi:MAG TPA: Hsp20/alpha crystallin family protein [Abditibacterium sp.]|jgi:HSP20 family protein